MGKKGNSEKENKREVKESEKGKEESERKSQNSERKNDLFEKINDRKFQILCLHAINILELKIKILQEEMMVEKSRSIISSLTHRIKSPDSIEKKLQKKKVEVSFQNAREKLNDIVGIRATFFYEDDIYEMIERLCRQEDITVKKRKDYMKKPKVNGYKSYHLIVEIPVYSENGCSQCKVEIQFRTVAMDFWAQLDYQLCYKKEISGEKHKDVEEKLAMFAQDITRLDESFMGLRKEIEVI